MSRGRRRGQPLLEGASVGYPLNLAELLGQVRVIEPGVAVLKLQALKLSGCELQSSGAFPIADSACQSRGDQAGAGQFLPAHRESLHRETTFSRSSYPTTFSCSSSRRGVNC